MNFISGFLIGMSICIFIGFNYTINTYGYDFMAWTIGIAGCIVLGAGFSSGLEDGQ